MGVGESDFVIMQVARLDALKDHLTAIRMLHQIIDSRPTSGSFWSARGRRGRPLRRRSRDFSCSLMSACWAFATTCQHLLAAADIFLLTSVSEGIPLTVIEAMAAGLPVVEHECRRRAGNG